jgi:glycosyltransferase involved in cell wall biosynthesis
MPLISVILPVYNGEAFLAEAIDSMLAQTFTDFELLVINDGSTDGSAQIIDAYNDARIRHLKNSQNQGLIYSLNKAVAEARGVYVARMDADDIAMPQRLEKQLVFLQRHKVAVVATRVKLIDADGKPLPSWEDEWNNVSFQQIKRFLLKDNCLAHPTVMGRTELFKAYPYQANQKYSEDYDLWLRLIAAGYRIEKLEEPLLLHRILPTSATRFKKINVFYRLAKVKFRFLWQQIKQQQFRTFHLSLLLFASMDLVKAAAKEVKAIFTK